MRLSTSTNIMDRYNREQGHVTMEDCIKRCYKAGYKVLDMNFHDMSNPGMPMAKDNWEEWVNGIGELAESLGVIFSQSHSYFYNVCNPNISDIEYREELVMRSLKASSILGIDWVVMHAGTDREQGYSYSESKRKNMEYFKQWLDMAKVWNIGIAIENLYDPLDKFTRTYSAAPEELIDLVDSFNDESVGVCWDFGHANLSDIDQNKSLRLVGKRLKATHISDNKGERDEHLLPFYGFIDWTPIMQTLKEIDYNNDFTFEITPFPDRVPPEIRDTLLVHTVEVGNYLINLAR